MNPSTNCVTNSMQGKFCVVTGATSGIGKAAAIGSGLTGANVIVTGRNQNRGKRVVNLINSNTLVGQAESILCDLLSQQQVRKLAEKIRKTTKRVDVLVNSAGANCDSFQLSKTSKCS